jgi:hypothetical protein
VTPAAGFDEVGATLSDHDVGRIRVAADDFEEVVAAGNGNGMCACLNRDVGVAEANSGDLHHHFIGSRLATPCNST